MWTSNINVEWKSMAELSSTSSLFVSRFFCWLTAVLYDNIVIGTIPIAWQVMGFNKNIVFGTQLR